MAEGIRNIIAAWKRAEAKVCLWWRLRQLRSRYWEKRKKAAEKLGNAKNDCAVKPLMYLLKDTNFLVQVEAALALGKIGHTQAVDPLLVALKHEYRSVREAAARALGMIGDIRAAESLAAVLRNASEDVRITAWIALEKIKDTDRKVHPL